MNEILKIIFSFEFIATVLRVTTPILLAALAAMIPKLAGVTNIAAEGVMLFSSLFAVICSAFTKNIWMGLLGGIATGILISLFMSFFILEMKADSVLAGVAINLMGSGGTIFILYILTGEKGISSTLNSGVLPVLNIPIVKNIPILSIIISGHNLITYVAFTAVLLCYLFLYKTPTGLNLRAVGENPNAATSVGVKVKRLQYLSMIISGLLAGLGGVYMSMGYVSWFSTNITAGRGFIGLAAQAIGGASPLGTMLASLLFGVMDALATLLQSLQIPAELVSSTPYVVTILALILYSVIQKKRQQKGV